MNSASEMEIVNPTEEHTHTIIFLHGRDSNAKEFRADFLESQASDDRHMPEIFPKLKWVFPTSRIRLSQRFQVDMSQWFDMWTTESPEEHEETQLEGLNESISQIWDVVRQEMEFVPSSRIILAGISQGCATAIHTLLQSDLKFCGFIGLAGWLPFQEQIHRIASDQTGYASPPCARIRELLRPNTSSGRQRSGSTFQAIPVLLGHSTRDAVIGAENGEKLRATLVALGMSVEWHAYDNDEHWVTEPQGIDDIVTFLQDAMTRF